jgi:hypothetical protein
MVNRVGPKNKTIKMKKTIYACLALATLIIGNACQPPSTPVGHCSGSTEFRNIITTNLGINEVTMDAQVHSYAFEVTASKAICKIGYQNRTGVAGLNYTLEVFDETTGQTVYSANKVFSTTAMDYIIPTANINLIPGHMYWLKRIQASNNFAEQIGSISNSPLTAGFSFPLTNGAFRILGTKYYSLSTGFANGSAIPDMIPFIDIQFQ